MTTSTTESIRSARIREFAESAARDASGARAALVADLEKAAGPLVEDLGEDRFLVTFVYLGEASSVSVYSHLILNDEGERPLMERVPGSDVWYHSVETDDDRLCVTYRFLVDSRVGGLSVAEVERLTQTEEGNRQFAADWYLSSVHDPFNPDRLAMDGRLSFARDPEILAMADDPAEFLRWESVLSLPGATVDDELGELLGLDHGVLEEHSVPSAVFGGEREVTVWTPPGGARREVRHSLLLVLDGPGAIAIGLPSMLSAMVERGRLRPTIAVFVHNKNSWSRSEEMICNPKIVTQYADEILPWVRDRYPVTDNPARTVVSGASYGGLGSSWLAYSRPDLFGNVLSMSGSYPWGMRTAWGASKESGVFGFDDEPEWLTRQYAAHPRKPIRFWLGVGTLEQQRLPGGITMLSANRSFRSVLRARDYDVEYEEFHGGHDRSAWRLAFVKGLRHLIGAEVPEV